VKLWRWNKGRQGTGYDVFPFLISKWLKADCYLIRLKKGVTVSEHKDEVKIGRHFRFNIHFGWFKGGVLSNEKFIWDGRTSVRRGAYLFRPDESKHSVSEVTSGTLYIFSVGWLRN
jgi:hypothetical protein